MLCFRYKKILVPYIEDALDEGTKAKLERHLGGCERCRFELEIVRSMSSVLSSVENPAAEPAADLWAKVSARIADENIQPAPRGWFTTPQLAAASAVVVLAAVVGFGLLRPGAEVKPVHKSAAKPMMARVDDENKARVFYSEPSKPAPLPKAKISGVSPNKPVAKTVVIAKLDYHKPQKLPKPVMMASLPSSEAKELRATTVDADKAPTLGDRTGYPINSAERKIVVRAETPIRKFNYRKNYTAARPAAVAAAPAPVAAESSSTIGRSADNTMFFALNASTLNAGAYSNDTTRSADTKSVVDDLNETEGVRTAAIFAY